MKYVLDSSVAVKWVLNEAFSDKARQLRDDGQNYLHDLLAPESSKSLLARRVHAVHPDLE